MYADPAGIPIARKVRAAGKRFWWEHPDPTARGGWRKDLPDHHRPSLYRRPELTDASLVMIVEGEKAADRVAELGLTSTCGPAGASSWKPEWTRELLDVVAPGATIVILPDHDHSGHQHGERVARDLHEHRRDEAMVVKIMCLPGLTAGGDVWDWLEARHTRAELFELVASTPVWSPGAAERQRAQRRAEQQRERRRKARAQRSVTPIVTRTPKTVAVRVALDALLHEVCTTQQPRSGRQLKATLRGQHPRDVVDEALRIGVEQGVLAVTPTARNTKLYRPGPAALTYTGFSRPDTQHGAIATGPDTGVLGFAKQTAVSECPEALKPEAAVNASGTLQKTLYRSTTRHTPASASGHSTDIQKLQQFRTLRTDTAGARGPKGRDTTVASLLTAAARPSDTSPGSTRTEQPPERQQAIDRGDCCGQDGSQPRCKLCRWSALYWRRGEATA